MLIGAAIFEKSWQLLRSKKLTTISLVHSIPKYLTKKNEIIYPYKDLYVNLHNNFFFDGKNPETILNTSVGE